MEKNGTDNPVEQGSVATAKEGESRVSVEVEAAEAAPERAEKVDS